MTEDATPVDADATHDADTSDDAGDDDASAAAGSTARPGRRPLLVAVLVVALLVASGLAVWQTMRLGDAQEDADRRTAAARAASEFTITLLSYDFEDLDAQADRIAELATEEFAEEFADAMDAGLGSSIEELRARSTASVTEVMVSEVPGDRARAIVLADSEITSEAGSRSSTGTYLDVALVHLDGRWQVDDVRTVATQAPEAPSQEGDAPADGVEEPADGGEEPAGDGDAGDEQPAG